MQFLINSNTDGMKMMVARNEGPTGGITVPRNEMRGSIPSILKIRYGPGERTSKGQLSIFSKNGIQNLGNNLDFGCAFFAWMEVVYGHSEVPHFASKTKTRFF